MFGNSFGLPHLIAICLLLIVVAVILVIVLKRRPATAVQPDADAPINTLAVVAFVLAFVATIPAVVLGHIALKQIDSGVQRGRRLAQAALVVGYAATIVWVSVIAGLIIWRATTG